ncbi:GAF and ANTAR domain-containing protein [Streptacidiphilus sp. N1-12]|uniref:GAF and ANTAR domain-containing protein n=2 Tax=Streptacidiphilus alkalitolerans TaxID=3342712 RepID=A0ABV6VI57_9ACTN
MADLARVAIELTSAAQGVRAGVLDRLCEACVRTLPVDGAAISMMTGPGRPVARSASSRQVAGLEELQFTLGEGPGMAAFTLGEPVTVADLYRPDSRWPVFAAQAATVTSAAGCPLRAVYAFPLALGRVPLGVLDLYRSEPSDLDPELDEQARLAVDTVALVLAGTAGRPAGGGPGADWLHDSLLDQVEVDQAVGMAMVQLGVASDEALARLRGYAFAHGLTMSEVASAIVGRTLRLSRGEQ